MSSRPTVMVIIDALGYELAALHGFEIRALPHRRRLSTVLGFSQAALTSMLTGSDPSDHGSWMMYGFGKSRSQFRILKALNPFGGTERLWIRRLLEWKLANLDGISSYYSLYSIPGDVLSEIFLSAERSVFEKGGGGRMLSIVDVASSGGGVFVRDYRTPERDAFEDLRKALERGEESLYILYTARLDSALHSEGTTAPAISGLLQGYSDTISALASDFPEARMIVTGDHGMCDVGRRIDLMSKVESCGLEPVRDYLPFYDATMARFSVRSPEAERTLLELLRSEEGGSLLDRSELSSLGAFFPGGEFGDMIFLCDTGVIIAPSHMGVGDVRGMHGFNPKSPCMDSLMLSNEDPGPELSAVVDLPSFVLPGFEPCEVRL